MVTLKFGSADAYEKFCKDVRFGMEANWCINFTPYESKFFGLDTSKSLELYYENDEFLKMWEGLAFSIDPNMSIPYEGAFDRLARRVEAEGGDHEIPIF